MPVTCYSPCLFLSAFASRCLFVSPSSSCLLKLSFHYNTLIIFNTTSAFAPPTSPSQASPSYHAPPAAPATDPAQQAPTRAAANDDQPLQAGRVTRSSKTAGKELSSGLVSKTSNVGGGKKRKAPGSVAKNAKQDDQEESTHGPKGTKRLRKASVATAPPSKLCPNPFDLAGCFNNHEQMPLEFHNPSRAYLCPSCIQVYDFLDSSKKLKPSFRKQAQQIGSQAVELPKSSGSQDNANQARDVSSPNRPVVDKSTQTEHANSAQALASKPLDIADSVLECTIGPSSMQRRMEKVLDICEMAVRGLVDTPQAPELVDVKPHHGLWQNANIAELYGAAFGKAYWRYRVPLLHEEKLIKAGDILLGVFGAMIYQDVFQSALPWLSPCTALSGLTDEPAMRRLSREAMELLYTLEAPESPSRKEIDAGPVRDMIGAHADFLVAKLFDSLARQLLPLIKRRAQAIVSDTPSEQYFNQWRAYMKVAVERSIRMRAVMNYDQGYEFDWPKTGAEYNQTLMRPRHPQDKPEGDPKELRVLVTYLPAIWYHPQDLLFKPTKVVSKAVVKVVDKATYDRVMPVYGIGKWHNRPPIPAVANSPFAKPRARAHTTASAASSSAKPPAQAS